MWKKPISTIHSVLWDMVLISHELPGVILKPIQNWHEWMVEIGFFQKDVEEADFNHPFMPVLDWFEDNTWQFMADQDHINNFIHSWWLILRIGICICLLITSQNVETVTPSTQLDH
jgi:hypothetical protein